MSACYVYTYCSHSVCTTHILQIQVGAAEYAAEVFQLPLSVLLKQHDEAEVSSVSPSEGSGRGGGRGGSLSPAGALKRTSSLFYTVSKVVVRLDCIIYML